MTEISRREFARLAAVAGIAAGLPLAAESNRRMIGIQVGAASFVDEGVAPVLDRFQHDVAVNTLFVAGFSYGRGIAGRQVPGQPLPDHGRQEYDVNFHGGNFARQHQQYYGDTSLKKIQAPDHPDFDVLAAVLPEAKRRNMQTICWYEDVFRRDLEGIDRMQEVTLSGRNAGTLCFHNPEVQAFWQALTEDFVRSYPLDGIMWGSERQGPFGNLISASHGSSGEVRDVTCFCKFCENEARSRGLDVRRAREGYGKLADLRRATGKSRPSDGYFVSYWRLLVQYPEILAWEKLWNDGLRNAYLTIHHTAKSIRPEVGVGWHIWHNNSFSPFYRAEQDYADFSTYSDFLKVVMYNNCGGPRMASYIQNVVSSIFGDLATPEEAMALNNKLLNYNEPTAMSALRTGGLSADYVARETKRALAGVKQGVKIWPGIDLDIPTGAGEKKTAPEDVRAAVRAALGAGADGVILSRKYSEMKLANLRAAGDAVHGMGSV